MENEAKEKGYPLGGFEEIVLLAVYRLGTRAYGVPIHEAVEEATQHSYAIGAIYTTLSRLEDKGLLSSYEGPATQMRGGRAKRYYQVTGLGELALNRAELTRAALKIGTRPEFGLGG